MAEEPRTPPRTPPAPPRYPHPGVQPPAIQRRVVRPLLRRANAVNVRGRILFASVEQTPRHPWFNGVDFIILQRGQENGIVRSLFINDGGDN